MSQEIIKVCIDRILPQDQLVAAATKALDENPANAPMFVRRLGVPQLMPEQIALLAGKMWRDRRTLRVRFLDGEPSVHTKVEQYAHQWSQYANITFEFGSTPDAEIRISFQQPGSWSYIGTDCLQIGRSDPTMNFGWLTPTTADMEYSRVVLHEFGHALGCIHEHQNPTANIPWNKEAVYRYYMGPPNNWTREEVDTNLFEHYSRNLTNFTEFDPTSIMEYAIPKELTIGGFEIGWNTEISARDKEFIGERYPLRS